jgi:tetratricopeptide (TPR) repeat protein
MNISNSGPLHTELFVGREDYLREFEAFLNGERDYRVLFIHGPGGIGKTWLLRHMMGKAQKRQHPDYMLPNDFIDMYSTNNYSIEGVRASMISLLGENSFPKYRKSRANIATAEREEFREDILQNMRQQLQADFLADCRNLSKQKKVLIFFDTFEHVQRAQVGSWVLTELSRELPNFRFVIVSREKWGGNSYIKSFELESFSRDELQEYFTKRVGSKLNQQVLKAIYDKVSGHPLLIELAIDFGLESLLSGQRFASEEESDTFLVNQLQQMSKNDFERKIIEQLPKTVQGKFGSTNVSQAIEEVIPIMAYFNRRFSAELLQEFINEDAVNLLGLSPKEILAALEQDFFFVKSRPDGYIQLHDEMERLVNQYLWSDEKNDWKQDLTSITCRWYDKKIHQEDSDSLLIEELEVEKFLYLLKVDVKAAANLLEKIGSSFKANELLVTGVEPITLRTLPEYYRYLFGVNFGGRAGQIYSYIRGQEYWKIAIDAAQNNNNIEQTIEAYLGLHNCTYPTSLDKSLDILVKKALPLCEHYENKLAQVFYEVGFTYSRKQQYKQAIEYYELAKKERDKTMMATILNDMGYVYVFWGRYEQAARHVKKARELRREHVSVLEDKLTAQKKEANIVHIKRELAEAYRLLGLSFNTLGQVKRFEGDFSAAEGAYSEGLEFFKRPDIQDFSWQARALHSRGEVYRRLAEIFSEHERIDNTQEHERLAWEDLQKCLRLCDQYGITEKHTVYRRMGRLIHDQALRTENIEDRLARLEDARQYFKKGLQAAKDTKNLLEELENLTEIAFLVDDCLDAMKRSGKKLSQSFLASQGQDIENLRDAVNKNKQQGQDLFHFSVFQHLLELEDGAFQFLQNRFEQAFENYKKGYAGLAKMPGYGSARYRQHLKHLIRQVYKLNYEQGKTWAEGFINLWQNTAAELPDGTNLTLAQVHPALVEEMQLYLDTAFLSDEK